MTPPALKPSKTEPLLPGLVLWCRFPGTISWAGMSVGIGMAFLIDLPTFHDTTLTSALWVALILCGLIGVLLRSPWIRFTAFLVLGFGLVLHQRFDQKAVFGGVGTGGSHAIELRGKSVSPPLPHLENFHFLLRVDSASPPWTALRDRVVNCYSPVPHPHHTVLSLKGRFAPPRRQMNPYEYDEFSAMMARHRWGHCTTAAWQRIEKPLTPLERLSRSFRGISLSALWKIRDYDNRALLQACFLGNTVYLSPHIKERFRVAGIYHLLAISGLHTAMLTGAIYVLLRIILRLNLTLTHFLCIGVLWAYLPFVGMIPSLFRATVMATLVIVTFLLEKKVYSLQAVGLAGTAWLLLSPGSITDPGYQLTFSATAGLVLFTPFFMRILPSFSDRLPSRALNFVVLSLCVSVISFLTTAPVLLWHFGRISLVGPLVNLVAVPAMTCSMWSFFTGIFFQMLFPPFAAVPLWISERFMDIVVGATDLVMLITANQISLASPAAEQIVILSILLLGLVAVRRGLLVRYLILGGVASSFFIGIGLCLRMTDATLTTVQFYVPRATIVAVRWPDRRVWLLLEGKKGVSEWQIERHVVPWLRHQGGNRCEAVVLLDDQNEAPPHPSFARARTIMRLALSENASLKVCEAGKILFASRNGSGLRLAFSVGNASAVVYPNPTPSNSRDIGSGGAVITRTRLSRTTP